MTLAPPQANVHLEKIVWDQGLGERVKECNIDRETADPAQGPQVEPGQLPGTTESGSGCIDSNAMEAGPVMAAAGPDTGLSLTTDEQLSPSAGGWADAPQPMTDVSTPSTEHEDVPKFHVLLTGCRRSGQTEVTKEL